MLNFNMLLGICVGTKDEWRQRLEQDQEERAEHECTV